VWDNGNVVRTVLTTLAECERASPGHRDLAHGTRRAFSATTEVRVEIYTNVIIQSVILVASKTHQTLQNEIHL